MPGPTGIKLIQQRLQKLFIFAAAVKIPAAPQDQCLFNSTLEPMMPLLNITVLIRMARLCLTTAKTIMIGQSPVVDDI